MWPSQDRRQAHLIELEHKAFPQASLRLSSIVPARGRHNVNNAIGPSNRNLQVACDQKGVELIDLYKSFVANTGAPRLTMYSEDDPRHPSRRRTSKLAVSIKCSARQVRLSRSWYSFVADIKQAMLLRDKPREQNMFVENKQRKRVFLQGRSRRNIFKTLPAIEQIYILYVTSGPSTINNNRPSERTSDQICTRLS